MRTVKTWDFSQDDRNEIEELGELVWEEAEDSRLDYEKPLNTNPQWLAIAYMALGKAQAIDEGFFNWSDKAPLDMEQKAWSAQLRAIAFQILAFLQ